MLSALPGGEVPVVLKGRVYAGVAPTGSLFIDMPQFVTSGSPERWVMFPHVCGADAYRSS